MRRKLIKQDAFDNIMKESITTAQCELVEAQHVLAKALGKGPLSLHCFNESTVVYETPEKSYVHAGYNINNGNVTFNNVEELVIDETTRKNKMRSTLSEMVDSILVNDNNKAKALFCDYLKQVRWNESVDNRFSKKQQKTTVRESIEHNLSQLQKDLREAYVVARHVLDYADFVKHGPVFEETITKRDEKGNITDIRIPTNEARNNKKIKSFDWQVTNHQNFQVRNKAVPALVKEQKFCKAIANLKRQNNLSDAQGLEEALEEITTQWPQLLLVTQNELASLIGEALTTMGVTNYDDQTCEFMAEGILRKAFDCYQEKVNQILHLASAPKCEENSDPYLHFQKVVESFYPMMDEKYGLERKAFSDLYDVLENVYKNVERNPVLKSEAASHLNGIADVLNGEIRPDIVIVEDAAKWVVNLIETNLKGGEWNVSNKPHLSVTGDHPDMAKKAAHSYTPSKDGTGDWGDTAPMIKSDSMSYKGNSDQARKNSWGNVGGNEVFPSLKNPYVPKPFGDYTMKGEKGVDKDATGQHHATWSSGETWPDLKNPYVPKEAGGVGGKGYKAKTDNLLVDK